MMQIYAAGQPIENRVTADYANLRGGTIELPAIYEASPRFQMKGNRNGENMTHSASMQNEQKVSKPG